MNDSIHTCSICYDTQSYFVRCKVCRNQQCDRCSIKLEKCPFCRSELYTPSQRYEIKRLRKRLGEIISKGRHTEGHQQKVVMKEMCWMIVKYKKTFMLPVFTELRESMYEFITKNKKDIPMVSYFIYTIFK